MIVIEGPDGSGKSTLARQVAEEFNLVVEHTGGPSGDKRHQTYVRLGRAVGGFDRPFVYDRFMMSEAIYGRLLRKGVGSQFTAYEEGYVVGVLNALQCPVILCLPPLDVCSHHFEANLDVGDDQAGVGKQLPAIWQAYENTRQIGPWTTVYDYTRTVMPPIMETIQDYLTTRRQRTHGTT